MNTLQLGNLQAGKGQPAFIIAEIGINHQGDVNIARKLVNMAKECGANAVKLQKRSLSRILQKKDWKCPTITKIVLVKHMENIKKPWNFLIQIIKH